MIHLLKTSSPPHPFLAEIQKIMARKMKSRQIASPKASGSLLEVK